jgi:hypothetical protein
LLPASPALTRASSRLINNCVNEITEDFFTLCLLSGSKMFDVNRDLDAGDALLFDGAGRSADRGAIVAGVMVRARCTAYSSFCSLRMAPTQPTRRSISLQRS